MLAYISAGPFSGGHGPPNSRSRSSTRSSRLMLVQASHGPRLHMLPALDRANQRDVAQILDAVGLAQCLAHTTEKLQRGFVTLPLHLVSKRENAMSPSRQMQLASEVASFPDRAKSEGRFSPTKHPSPVSRVSSARPRAPRTARLWSAHFSPTRIMASMLFTSERKSGHGLIASFPPDRVILDVGQREVMIHGADRSVSRGMYRRYADSRTGASASQALFLPSSNASPTRPGRRRRR